MCLFSVVFFSFLQGSYRRFYLLDVNVSVKKDIVLSSFLCFNRDMKKILEELTFITNSMRNDDQDEKSALEWKFAATVLDRWVVTTTHEFQSVIFFASYKHRSSNSICTRPGVGN